MNKKRSITYALFLMLIGSFAACNKPSEDVDLQIAQIMEAVPTPLPFVDDPQALVPIDEEHFEGDFLRTLLKLQVDLDGDGCLSKSERETVEYLGFDVEGPLEGPTISIIRNEVKATSYETLFRYFPNLKRFECPRANAIVVRNNESIREVSHLMNDEGEMYKEATRDIIIVEGCPNFMSMYVGDVCKLVSVTDVPQGSVAINPYNLKPKYVFDGNLFVEQSVADPADRALSDFLDAADLTWVNVKKVSVGYKREDVEPLLLGAVVEEFSYEVSEKTEDSYDDNGVKGYHIYVDTKETVYATYPFKFSLYCEQKPEVDALKTRVSKVLDFTPLVYSPNRGVYSDALLSFDVVYESEAGEQVIGTIHKRRYCFIEPSGEVAFYSTEMEWDIPDYKKPEFGRESLRYLNLDDYVEYFRESETN